MDEGALLNLLEELADRLGVQLRHERVEALGPMQSGGLCKLRGEWVVFLNPDAPLAERVAVLSRALRKFDLSGTYVKPAVREVLENPPLPPTSPP